MVRFLQKAGAMAHIALISQRRDLNTALEENAPLWMPSLNGSGDGSRRLPDSMATWLRYWWSPLIWRPLFPLRIITRL